MAFAAVPAFAQTPVDITSPSDRVMGVVGTQLSGNYPSAESPEKLFDNNTGSKLLTFDKLNAGAIVVPASGPSIVSGMNLTSANDAPERDPVTYNLEGSWDGVTWTLIANGNIPAFTARAELQAVSFANTTPYYMYRLIFPTIANAGAANSMQLAEVELMGQSVTDVVPPLVARISTPSATAMSVQFNEPVNIDAANVTFDNGVTMTGASLSGDFRTVTITTTPRSVGTKYTISVSGLADRAPTPNVLPANSAVTFVQDIRPQVGVNFAGRGDPVNLGASEVVGLVPQQNFNNVEVNPDNGTASGNVGPFMNANGEATPVRLNYAGNDSWNSDGPTTTANDRFFRGIHKRASWSGFGPNSYTFENVPAGYYDVYTYMTMNGDNVQLNVAAGDVTYYVVQKHQWGGSFVRASNSSSTGTRDVGNYVLHTNLAPNTAGKLSVTAGWVANSDGLGIAGFQLVPAPLRFVTASSRGNPDGFFVSFAAPVDPVTGLDTANYTIDGGVTMSGASFYDAFTVLVHTSPLVEGQTYNITAAAAVKSAAGVALGTQGAATFVHGKGYQSARIHYKRWAKIAGGSMSDLFNNADFPDKPSTTASLTLFEDPSPDEDSAVNNTFGSQMYGLYQAPSTGNYTFAVASDDNSILYLSSDEQPANKMAIASEPQWGSGKRNYITAATGGDNNGGAGISSAKALVAGRVYYMEGDFAEGGGGNYFAAAAQEPGGPAIADGTMPISDSRFIPSRFFNGQPFFTMGPVSMAKSPVNTTNMEGTRVTFNCQVGDGTPPYFYQWYSNGVAVAGANAAKYSFRTFLDAEGAQISVSVSNEFSGVVTAPATLTVTPDLVPPSVVSVAWIGGTKVKVVFSEDMEFTSATDTGIYLADDGVGSVNPTGVELNGNVATLTFASLPSPNYNISVGIDVGVTVLDLAYNELNPAVVTRLISTLQLRETVVRRVWNGVTGTTVNDLLNNVNFPNNPSITELINIFEVPRDYGNDYGAQLFGFFTAPADGQYTFGIANDDDGRLYISTNGIPSEKRTLLNVGCCVPWRTYSGGGHSTLVPLELAAGQSVYLEGIVKEGGGGDYLNIAVAQGSSLADGTPGISGANINPSITAGPVFVRRGFASAMTVNESDTVTFPRVIVDGDSPYTYEWRTNGVVVAGSQGTNWFPEVPGVTFQAYTNDVLVEMVVFNQNGLSSVTNSALVHVVIDTIPPYVVRALPGVLSNTLLVVFSEPMAGNDMANDDFPTSAEDAFYYTITSSDPSAPNPASARLLSDKRTVLLTLNGPLTRVWITPWPSAN